MTLPTKNTRIEGLPIRKCFPKVFNLKCSVFTNVNEACILRMVFSGTSVAINSRLRASWTTLTASISIALDDVKLASPRGLAAI